MKNCKILATFGVAGLLFLTQAQATINLTSYATASNSSYPFDADNHNALQPKNNDTARWLLNCVVGYNLANNPDLPIPDSTFVKIEGTSPDSSLYPIVTGQSTLTITAGAYDYIVLHTGDTSAHNGYAAFYIGDETGQIKLTGNNGTGLSWYGLYNPKTPNTPSIPEPSTVVAGALLLLPFGISTLRIIRKRPTA